MTHVTAVGSAFSESSWDYAASKSNIGMFGTMYDIVTSSLGTGYRIPGALTIPYLQSLPNAVGTLCIIK